jgi:hypothetical protein
MRCAGCRRRTASARQRDSLPAQSSPPRGTSGRTAHRPAGALGPAHRDDRGVEVMPLHASMFGSAARGDGDSSSDIDLFVVRSAAVDADARTWRGQVERLSEHVRAWTGNHANVSSSLRVGLGWPAPAQASGTRQPRNGCPDVDGHRCHSSFRRREVTPRSVDRSQQCSPQDVRRRITTRSSSSKSEIAVGGHEQDPEHASVAVSLAVLVGVAAADTACCKALGERPGRIALKRSQTFRDRQPKGESITTSSHVAWVVRW